MSAPPALFRSPAPAPYFHPLFKNFSDSPPPGEAIKIYSSSFKKGRDFFIFELLTRSWKIKSYTSSYKLEVKN